MNKAALEIELQQQRDAVLRLTQIVKDQQDRIERLTAPSVPNAMPDATECQGEYSHGYANGWNACRAAILAAAPEVSRER